MATGAEIAQEMLQSGFSNDEVQAWMLRERARMEDSGFSREEIVTDLTGRPPVMEQTRERIRDHFLEKWEEARPEGAQVRGPSKYMTIGGVEPMGWGEAFARPPEGKQTWWDLSLKEAWDIGWGGSIFGMLFAEEVPKGRVGENQPIRNQVAHDLAGVIGDLPAMIAGFTAGAAAGTVYPPAIPVTALGGAFAVPAAIRVALVDEYANGGFQTFEEFWGVLSATVFEAFKGFVTGAATGAVGKVTKVAGASKLVQFGAETATMTAVGHGLHKEIPDGKDFVVTAATLGLLKTTVAAPKYTARGTAKLYDIYARTGRRPKEVLEDNQTDPTIQEDLLSRNIDPPRAYRESEEPPPMPPEPAVEPRPARKGREPRKGLTEDDEVILARVSVGERKKGPGLAYTLHDLYKRWFDDKHWANEIGKAMREDRSPDFIEDMFHLARLHVGVSGKPTHFLEHHTFKFGTYENIGPALRWILWPIRKNLDPFRSYMVSKRVVELDGRGIKAFGEEQRPYDVETARRVIANREAEYEPLRQELWRFQNQVLDYLHDSGVLDDASYIRMLELNRDFAPFFRVMDKEQAGTGKGLKTRDPIWPIKGNERQLIDPLESIIKNVYTLITLAERNEIATTFAKQVESSPRGAEFGERVAVEVRPTKITPEEIQRWQKKYVEGRGEELAPKEEALFHDMLEESFTIFRPEAMRPKKDHIAFFRDGKRELWKVDPRIYEVFEGLDSQGAHDLVKLMRVPARTLRAGAIFSPEFIGRNPIRDQLSAWVFSAASDFRYVPVWDWMRGVFHLARKDEVYQDWLKSGGPMATFVSLDRQYLQKNIRQLLNVNDFRTQTYNVAKSPLEILRIISEFSEQTTRVGGFQRATGKKIGVPLTKAEIREGGFKSREMTLDFGRMGRDQRTMNQISAFWNANLQGQDKMVRSFITHPRATSMRIFAGITLPSITLYLVNKDKEYYKELPDWEKDMMWHIEVSEDNWWRLPKPFEAGIIFGSGAERIVAHILEGDPRAFDNYMDVSLRSLGTMAPTGIVPLMETWANRRLYFDQPLIGKADEGILPEFAHPVYTTELSKMLGHMVARIPGMRFSNFASPAVIDTFIYGWTGGLGRHVADAADVALRKAGVLPDPVLPMRTWADIPFVKAFVSRYPKMSSDSVVRFWDRYTRQQKVLATIEHLKKENRVKEARRQYEITGGLIDTSSIAEGIRRITRATHRVYLNPNLSSEEKRYFIDNWTFQVINLAQRGNAVMDRAEARALRKATAKAMEAQ